MYTSIEIKGFRCFKHLTIPKLARINLIGGKNNTGKTALLEAVRVLADAWAHPHTVLPEMYRFRGLDRAGMASLGFSDLVVGFRPGGEATVLAFDPGHKPPSHGAEGAPNVSVTVSVSSRTVPGPERNAPDVPGCVAVVKEPGRGVNTLWLAPDGRYGAQDETRGPATCVFVPAREHLGANVLAEWFRTVEVEKLEGHVVRALGHVDERVRDLRMVPVNGSFLLYVDLGGPLREPIGVVGEGMGRVCALVLGLCNARGGVLLADEVESGLHYSVLPDVWRAIAHAAKELDVQVFATTHSHECVLAAHEATADMPEDTFLYHRLDRVDGEVVCRTYRREVLAAAFETELEVR